MKINLKYKLYSGALQFTIFISVLIALLLAGILMLTSTHKFFIEQSRAIIDNIQIADDGIEILLDQEEINIDTLSVDLPESRENQSLKTHLSNWGIFEKAYSIAKHRKKTFIKCALMGSGMEYTNRPAVYLTETFNPLAVVGNTEIRGKAILPLQGVRPGNIMGNSYYGKELIYGTIEKSLPDLPKLKYNYKDVINYYLHTYQPEKENEFIPIGNPKIVNSFKDQIKGFYSKTEIVLENTELYGNIIIRSDEKVTVKKTAILKDIIIAAPIIIIDDGVKGNFQAIVDTSIKVGKECQLNYPSALVMLEKEKKSSIDNSNEFDNKIFIDSNSIVKGSICYFNTTIEERDFQVNIFIGNQSVIKGEIYCNGNLELKNSNVEGSVFTNHFISNEGGTTFVNHIYNSGIFSDKLPEEYGGIIFENQSKNIMKWLY